MVPAIRVLTWVFSSLKNLARPKSAILGFRFPSRRILLAFMSLCTMRDLDSSCKYIRPRAIARQMLNRVDQSIKDLFSVWMKTNIISITLLTVNDEHIMLREKVSRLPSRYCERLLFSKNSKTNIFSWPLIQHPSNFTRLRWCTVDKVKTSLRNSFVPLSAFEESFFTAIIVPFGKCPYK